MNSVPELDTLLQRSLDSISLKLRSALHFLNEYELLVPEGNPLLDSSYDAICQNRSCVQSSIVCADVEVNAFKTVFIDCPAYTQLKAISCWTFEFRYGVGLFHSVADFKSNIQSLLDSISSGEIINPPAAINRG
ncbi:MAG: hypothetical protein WAW41_04110 [Methylobacter sp.]